MSDSHLLNTNNIVNLDTYLSDNYVTQDTEQTITAEKTIANTVNFKHGGTYSATPSTRQYYCIVKDYDTSNKIAYHFDSFTDTSGITYSRHATYDPTNVSRVGIVQTEMNSSGTRLRFLCGTTNLNLEENINSTTSDDIAVKGWVNNPATATNVVHRSGNETIDGTKTFVNGVGIKNVSVASSNSTPTSNQHRYISCTANDGTYTSLIDCSKLTNGYSGTGIYARSGSYTSGILVSVGNDGTTTTSSPNPTDSVETTTASTQIATVGWTNTKLNKKMTNCLLSVPQDINLSVSNGTVTLAAGSKVWFPYGTSAPTLSVGSSLNGGVVSAISWNNNKLFYQVRYDTAITQTDFGSATNNIFIGVRDSSHLEYGVIRSLFSGTTPTDGVFYNTSTNTISYYQSGSLLRSNLSLPIAFGHRTSGTVDSIDQILNGMSYCGSVVFAFPGLKGLLPNGRNSDGSLKSNEYNITYMQLTDVGVQRNSRTSILLGANTIESLTAYKYDLASNYNKNTLTNSITSKGLAAFITTDTASPYNITSLKMKTTVQYLDESNSNLIASYGMPSSNYINLTLGASNSTYTAPANGWVTISKNANTSSSDTTIRYLYVQDNNTSMMDYISANSGTTACIVTFPVYKDEVFNVIYTATGTTVQFSFIYAQGEV